jgi:hypothetical protein
MAQGTAGAASGYSPVQAVNVSFDYAGNGPMRVPVRFDFDLGGGRTGSANSSFIVKPGSNPATVNP